MPASNDLLLWALLSAVFAAATAILAKLGLEGVDSDFERSSGRRSLVACWAAWSTSPASGRTPRRCPVVRCCFWRCPAWLPARAGLCYFRALKVGEASRVAPIDKLSVVLVAIFAVIFLGERPAIKDSVGIALVGAVY